MEEGDLLVCEVNVQPWVLKFDGSSTDKSVMAGVVITSSFGTKIALSFTLDFECINNQAKYDAH